MKEISVPVTMFLDNTSEASLLDHYSKAAKRLLLLDYDGSLVPFAKQPALASPGRPILETLSLLAGNPRNEVYIISGRDSHILEKWFNHLPVNLIAEHGAKVRKKNGEWNTEVTRDTKDWMPQIEKIMGGAVVRCSGSFIERKEFSLAWHYRNVETMQGSQEAKELFEELHRAAKDLHLNVLSGNKVIEVRIDGIDKGMAAKKVLHSSPFDFILSIGDDRTDEDMFQQLAEVPGAFTIKVGDEASSARYNVHTPYVVESLLRTISLQLPA